MDDYTLINHFSAYNSGANEVKAVILGTNYGSGYEDRTISVEENGVTQQKLYPFLSLYQIYIQQGVLTRTVLESIMSL